ncbi:hypothetical protein [Sorangium sp. So ce388]|uniref:hypothetical protein n=1 Tax=Sorangium sp. So ce388 TaxID=3133309 RepID=UPI003F5B7784
MSSNTDNDDSRTEEALASEPTVEEDHSVIIASDDGRLFRLTKERWQDPDFEIVGPAKHWIEEGFLKKGVIAANLPMNPIEPFFACYLLNTAMLNKKTPENK